MLKPLKPRDLIDRIAVVLADHRNPLFLVAVEDSSEIDMAAELVEKAVTANMVTIVAADAPYAGYVTAAVIRLKATASNAAVAKAIMSVRVGRKNGRMVVVVYDASFNHSDAVPVAQWAESAQDTMYIPAAPPHTGEAGLRVLHRLNESGIGKASGGD